MVGWLRKNHHVAAAALLVACFFPLLWIAQYDYPNGDDYAALYHAQHSGTVGAVRWWYLNWTGRYTSFLVQSLVADYGAWLLYYKIVPAVLLVGGYACLFCCLRVFLGPRFENGEIFTLTALFYILLVSLTPDAATAIYWLPTGVQYLGAVFVSLLLFAAYVAIEEAKSRSRKIVLTLAAALLIALLAGLNEISLIFFAAAMSLVIWVRAARRQSTPKLAIAFLTVAVCFGLLSLLAPGNAVRVSQINRNAHILGTMVRTIALTGDVIADPAAIVALLVAGVLYLVFLQSNRARLDHVSALSAGVRWYAVLAVLIVATISSLGLVASSGIHGLPQRVRNLYVYNLTLGWFCVVTVLFLNLNRGGRRLALPDWAVGLLGAALVIVALSGFARRSIFADAYLDLLSGRAARYARENAATTARFAAAQGECIEVSRPSDPPQTIFLDWVKYPWTWCASQYGRSHGERAH